ncbi:alanine racemase [Bordetella genomosp. 9]|uniref:Alanine racemase n=1 Tax=Bordetella genomosp. 9 TaxID=1416803 RepID=A0A261RFQ7_9BORD|nr:alanine racemase [Bordetella genomosp. 9]OZI23878.1 alanine racemase [Bordetella genomosp. 9]
MSRPAYASIDLDALRGNYAVARRMHGGRVLAVLKADAYGHGAAACARALAGLADGYAVAFTDEALALRQAGVDAPILVLEGAFDARETQTALHHGLWLAVHRQDQIAWLAEAATPLRPTPCQGDAPPRASDAGIHAWLKVDSGMHRAGFIGAEVRAAHQALQAIPAISQVTLMTHFARADEPHSDMTATQTQSFDSATAGLPGPRSLCNSAGLMAWPDARHDWGRAGIMLYGADPLPASGATLRPVMTLHSEIFGVRELAAGEPVGYGATFITERPTRVGLVAMGYADGYPRNAPNGTPVAIDGRPGKLIGRVSMDMLTVDLTDHPQARIGSRVELWGPRVPVSEVARAAGTIAYEILSNVKRVTRIYQP